ncbi:MAG: hypothetical protein OXC82_01320 [Rhodobacteraceae bacterium]|nr:hypothetical protein [Paracoccaceae bacterium]MCY4249067.1 hypothetical protein [Paracoccaceae bacterium]
MYKYTNLESTNPMLHWVEEYSANETDGNKNNWTFIRKDNHNNLNHLLSNWDVRVYLKIHQAIDQMTRLPEEDQLYLDQKIATRAINLLGFLKEQLKIPPPKIINQNGEALAYTWVLGKIKRYLIVADDAVDLMELSIDGKDSYEEVLSQDEDLPFDKIMERLILQTKSQST